MIAVAEGQRINPDDPFEHPGFFCVTLETERVSSMDAGKGAGSDAEGLPPLAWVAVWVALIGGAGVRLLNYWANRSLWHDEACLALNIVGRSFRGLLQPLDYIQAAPVGFLMLEKLSAITLGGSEYALRLWPLLAGIASLPLFFAVARRTITPRAAAIGLGLFATSGPLIYYSGEVKQYSSDVMIGLLILWVAVEPPGRLRPGAWLIRIGMVGAISIWFSHPAVFVLGGVGLALLGFRQDRVCFRSDVIALLIIWIVSFLNNYVLFTRATQANPSLNRMWAEGFITFPPASLGDCGRGLLLLSRAFSDPTGLSLPVGGAALAILGGIALGRARPRSLALIAGPIALALAASALGKYPFSGRLILFAAPLLIMLIAAGIDALWGRSGRVRRLLSLAIIIGLLVGPIQGTVRSTIAPGGREELRDVLRAIAQDLKPGDVIYVYYAARYAFLYYRDEFIPPDVMVVFGKRRRHDPAAYEDEIRRLSGIDNCIFLFSHNHENGTINEEMFFLSALDQVGERLAEVRHQGASAYVYRLFRLLDAVSDPLLDRPLYAHPHRLVSHIAPSGAVGVNGDWEAKQSDPWFIEQQRYGADLIQAGIVRSDEKLILDGWKILQWGFQRQGMDGNFPGTGDPFHSTSLFVEASARALLLLRQSGKTPPGISFRSYADRVHAAADWLMRPDVAKRGRQANQPYTHRQWILAAALGETAKLTGDGAMASAAAEYARAGLALQTPEGVNPEKGGGDVSYQALGVLMAERYYIGCEDPELRFKIKAMIDLALRWEATKIDVGGIVQPDGSTRTGKEASRGGKVKTVDHKTLVQAFVMGARITGNAKFAADAQRIAVGLKWIPR